jgi:hypothetical protein
LNVKLTIREAPPSAPPAHAALSTIFSRNNIVIEIRARNE